MAILQSDYAKFIKEPPTIGHAGVVQAVAFEYSFASQALTAASDIVEIGFLPALAKPHRARLIGEGLGAITADVGLMSGTVGDNVSVRTSGDELFDGTSVNDAEAEATALEIRAIAASTAHRSIGVKFSGNIAAGAGKKVTVILEYTF